MIVLVTNLQPFYKPFKHCFRNRLSSVPSKVHRKPLFAGAFGRAAPPPCYCFSFSATNQPAQSFLASRNRKIGIWNRHRLLIYSTHSDLWW
ncbi:hypothetical protein Hanom_Chr03g00230671 [Helianthus anomalus]